jgi:predicted nuclease with TOPRIM domain
MDTYRIYEQFREPFGEPAARALAETLGLMAVELRETVTKDDFRSLREAIDGDVSRLDGSLVRLAEAQARTEGKLSQLADAQARTEGKVAEMAEGQKQLVEAQTRSEGKLSELAEAQTRSEGKLSELAEAQARSEGKLSELAEAQARSEGKLSELAEAQARSEGKLSELAEAQAGSEQSIAHLDMTVAKLTEAQTQMTIAVQRLTIRTDDAVGRTFELQFRERLTSYLGRFLRRGKVVPNDRLLEQIERHLSEREVDDVLRADVIATGLVDGLPTHLVVEVSWTGDIDDIVRADERAQLLRRAGLATIPLVACTAISPESAAFAKLRQVRIWLNGSLLEAAA